MTAEAWAEQQFSIDSSDLKILHVFHLDNGDRISGRVVAETEREITLLNGAVGQVVLPKKSIRRREEVDVEALQLQTPPKATNAAPRAATNAPAQVAQTTPTTNAPPASANTNTVAAPKPVPPAVVVKPVEKVKGPKRWNTDLQLGLNLRWGRRDSEDFFTTLRSTYGNEPFRQTFDGSFAYGETEEVVSADKLTLSSKSEYNFSKRWYVYNLVGGGYDHVRKIDMQYEFGPGMGFEVLKRTNFVLKAEAGFTYQKQDRQDGANEETYSARLAQIFTWKVWDKLTADGRVEFFPDLQEFGEFRLKLDATFRYPLWKNVSLNLNVIDLYESQPAADVPKNDLQVRSAVGIKF